jgi:predicted metal-dependent phosphoesterase TrpH
LRFIRGVEIEIEFKPGEFHLLGLDFPPEAPGLALKLETLRDKRVERNHLIIEKFQADGYPVSYEELMEVAGNAQVGRPHIAELLTRKKIVKTKQVAFNKFLAKGRPYYFPKAAFSLEESVDFIHAAGALAFVAHPMSLFVSWTRITELFETWKAVGIDGIEAWHPTARLAECTRLERMAQERGFRVSAGSDYHGSLRPERKLGLTAGDRKIDDSFLKALER